LEIEMQTKKALAYLRTSSAANVGTDKDSDKRQMAAIEGYAGRAGFEIILPPYYDAAVSGADPIEGRPGFAAMLAYLVEHSEVRTILVEDASRFARGVVLQEVGYEMLKGHGITLIPVNAPDHFGRDTDPMTDAIRQMVGVMNELAKKTLVLNMRLARERKRAVNGKCEGRKSHAELRPDLVKQVHRLRRQNPRTGIKRSYREIASELAESGHVNANGRPYAAASIKAMLEQRA
jgi:DNA invertase Pin-like site-specific DNA recombinase